MPCTLTEHAGWDTERPQRLSGNQKALFPKVRLWVQAIYVKDFRAKCAKRQFGQHFWIGRISCLKSAIDYKISATICFDVGFFRYSNITHKFPFILWGWKTEVCFSEKQKWIYCILPWNPACFTWSSVYWTIIDIHVPLQTPYVTIAALYKLEYVVEKCSAVCHP